MGRIYPRSIIFVDSQIKKDSKLVNWVKLWPIIFDESDPLYFDSIEKEKIWEIIANNLQSTAKLCEERWRALVDTYEKYKKGYSAMHEVLVEQLDECLNNIIPQNNKHNKEEKQIYESSNIFLGVNEEIESSSSSLQRHGSFLSRVSWKQIRKHISNDENVQPL